MPVLEFDPPERFTAASVGPPGQRTFYLQAASGQQVVTVGCEKEQVAVLGERINDVLDRVAGSAASEEAATAVADADGLTEPVEESFRVSAISLVWTEDRQVLRIDLVDQVDPEELEEVDDEAVREVMQAIARENTVEPFILRVVLPAARARAFARRCSAAVAGGRPSCPFCGNPIDPEGHVCPRANGYRR